MTLRERTTRRILDAADELFFSRGVAATPIDAVIARAGVSAATLYRGFPSKDALLAAALERRHTEWIDAWDAAIRRADDETSRLLAVFDALDDFRARPGAARWCAFLAASAEYAVAPAEVAAAVSRDTASLRSRLTELARPLAGDDAPRLAEQLLVVITGGLAMRLREPGRAARPDRDIAAALLDRLTSGRSS